MAISLEAAVKVRQRVKMALRTNGASPGAAEAIKAAVDYLLQQKNLTSLQFIPFGTADITTNGGYSPDVDANTVYLVYLQGARTTGTTSSFVALHAATDNSATTTTLLTTRFKATGQEFLGFYPTGLACETELTVSGATAVGGATESTAADTANGFVIIGA